MSYARELNEKLNNGNSSEIIAVGSYARVSTDNDGQLTSCDNQIKSAEDFVNEHKNTVLKETYIDDGISGVSATKRPAYLKLMEDVDNHIIDLIFCKTTSRLFRSPMDAQIFVHSLLSNRVALYTQEDHKVWDFEDLSDLMVFSFKSVIDGNVSLQQSKYGHDFNDRRVRGKILQPKDVISGYRWNSAKKDIEIDEIYAKYIVEIHEDYVYRKETPSSIHKKLKEKGIKFPRNRRSKDKKHHFIEYVYLSERTISNIIGNPKYTGLFVINKRGSKFISGEGPQRCKNPEEDWGIIQRPDLQIIDNDLFEMVVRVRNNRINIYDVLDRKTTRARFQGTHLFASKVICPVCGKSYRFDKAGRKDPIPMYRIKKHSDCPNTISRITEADLVKILKETLTAVISNQKSIFTTLEQILMDCVEKSQNNSSEIEELKKQKILSETKSNRLVYALTTCDPSETTMKQITSELNDTNAEIIKYENQIKELEESILDESYVKNKLAEIHEALMELKSFNQFNREQVQNFVERIELPPNGDINILLRTGQIIVVKQVNNQDFSYEVVVGKNGNRPAPR